MPCLTQRKLATSLAVLLVVHGAAAIGQSVNRVVNPGFEDVEQGKALHWRFDREKIDAFGLSDDVRTGKRSVWGQLTESPSGSWWTEWFAVEPNTTYDVTVWVKVDRPARGGSVRVGVSFDTHGTPYRSRTLAPGKWHSITDTVRSWPNTTKARVRLLLHKWQGKTWFDDVSFRKSDVDWMDRFEQTDLTGLRFLPKHPCVAFSRTDIEELRQAVKTVPWAKTAYEAYMSGARRLLEDSPFRLPDLDFAKVGPGYTYVKGVARAVKDLGLLYQLTQDRKYAQVARDRLVAVAERLPKGNLCRGGYGYTTGYALHNAAIGYDFIHDSDVLSEDDRAKIESMLRGGYRGMSRHGDVMGINNRGAVCMGAMASIAFCLQDRELIEWVINGPYGFNYHLHKGVGDDGIWIEGISYGFMAMGKIFDWYCGYMAVAEAAHRAGIDLYSHPRFKRLTDAPLEYAYPDYSLPANGHCAYSTSLLGQLEARRYIKSWIRLRDPRYLWVISEGLKVHNWLPLGYAGDLFVLSGNLGADFSPGPAPKLESTLFPQIGHAMLRAGRGENAMAVLLDYGPFGSHGNPDKMTISLYAHDQVLCPDGITGYWWPTTFMYECQTIGHNTVVVDEKTQFPTAGKTLNAWLPAPGVTIVDAQDGEANVGVSMRRTLALTDRYLLDLFTVASDEVHRYDWAYHSFGTLKTSLQLTPKAGTLGVTDGYQCITGVRRGECADTWTAEWDLNEMNQIWNSSFELQTGQAWQVVGWRVPNPSWRQFVSVDTERPHSGRQSLRIDMPEGSREPARLLATGKLCRFRAGKQYRADAFVRISNARATEGDVGIWIGHELVARLSPQDATAATRRWVAIGGLYRPRETNRDFLRVGVNNVTGATVWFDDVRLRVAEGRANALRLTMLGSPDTEVIASDGQGLRPFQQPLLIARRRCKSTAFASVFEPYYGRSTVQSLRPLNPDQSGVEIVTDHTIDRFLTSDGASRATCPGLSVAGMIGAVSLDRATGALRWLCLGKGMYVAAAGWSLATSASATVCLEHAKDGFELRTWGERAARVVVQGPSITGQLEVHEFSVEGKRGRKVDAAAAARGLSFEIQTGRAYALGEPGSMK